MIKKLLIIAIIFILSSAYTHANFITLSEKSTVSLITCSAGEAIYELFGHTAIRVVDTENQLDIVFNYGLFSFEGLNLYLNKLKINSKTVFNPTKLVLRSF